MKNKSGYEIKCRAFACVQMLVLSNRIGKSGLLNLVFHVFHCGAMQLHVMCACVVAVVPIYVVRLSVGVGVGVDVSVGVSVVLVLV